MSTRVIPEPSEIARTLYRQLLAAWNAHDARAMAALFASNGNLVGFDGSSVNGRTEIEAHLAGIFAHHVTAAYVGIVREVRPLGDDVLLLRAVAGMIPPGKSEIYPAVNAVQTLVVFRSADRWSIALFQNTPAAFHGRPELVEQLTAELQAAAAAAR
jgi:uncharacterized protein (TIGR02246 family)